MKVSDFLDYTNHLPYNTKLAVTCMSVGYPIKLSDTHPFDLYAEYGLHVDIIWDVRGWNKLPNITLSEFRKLAVGQEKYNLCSTEDGSTIPHPVKGITILEHNSVVIHL